MMPPLMRIALLYPPPWKVPAAGKTPDPIDGPPQDYLPGDLDGDFYQTPYGLFTIGAQAIRAGHQVKVINLSSFVWEDVVEVVKQLDADVFGMSCWTANRRGVALVADQIRAHHPKAHIVVGGPHASPLAREMLQHHAAINTVTQGESELTFLEIVERVAAGQGMEGLAGAVYRTGGRIEKGPSRGSIDDLDTLASPHDYFDTHIMMTSRGCPWACTFCGAESQWGRGFRAHSVEYVLNDLEKIVERLPVKMVMIKDDTFTTNRKRVIELCRGIRERGIEFAWSCDTRVDLLGEDLLREMRLAGCERLSLGVESGAPAILEQVDKKITTDDIVLSTELAKKYGISVRYFMMLGNRGETHETFQQTLDFLERAKPHEYIFSCLSIYPGTRDFTDAEAAGWLDRKVFFSEPFQELKTPFDASDDLVEAMNGWFADHCGLQRVFRPTTKERRDTLALLPEHAGSHLDLGAALLEEGEWQEAELSFRRALELGHALPGLVLNYLACVAVERGDYDAMMDLYSEAARRDPQHALLIRNVNAARAWFKKDAASRAAKLDLVAGHDFQLLERTAQPSLPGPLPVDFADFSRSPEPIESPSKVAAVGSKKALKTRKQLKVLS